MRRGTWLLWLLLADLLGLLFGYAAAYYVFGTCTEGVCEHTLVLSLIGVVHAAGMGLILISGLSENPGLRALLDEVT